MLDFIKSELKEYYRSISHSACVAKGISVFNPLKTQMDEYDQAHPGLSAFQLKAAMYEIIAENFTPVLFKYNPFFFETGLKMAEYDGRTDISSGGWLFLRNQHMMWDDAMEDWTRYHAAEGMGLHLCYHIFDMDHHGFPYENVLKQGLSGILARLRQHKNGTSDARKIDFYDAAERGLLAMKRIAERFAEAAATAAENESDPLAKDIYLKIADTAKKVPWKPAETFYEGLATTWFLHELGSVMDGIGMAIIGSPDRLLIELYRNDIAAGRETPESVEELLKIWMVHTDCKLDFSKPSNEQYNNGEQGDTLTIGENVNELTFMLLKIHHDLKLIYPKIHCRISENTPSEYLTEACKSFMEGRNVLDFINDDVIVPAQIRAGKDPNDARTYVAGGCWEIMLPDFEHSEAANCYFEVARAMDLSIQSTPEEESALGISFVRPDKAESFEKIYDIFIGNIRQCISQMCRLIVKLGSAWPDISPAPFFSACMTGCIESGRDYTDGGAKYSPHGLPYSGLATFVNSLLVFKKLCFDEKKYPLSQLLEAVRHNWEGYENIRKEALSAPHLGDGSGEATQLLKRILNDLADLTAQFKNERGGPFQCGLFSYAEIYKWAKHMNATPDGRLSHEFLAQGITPTRLHGDVITNVLRDLSGLPLDRFPDNSLLTVSLPLNGLDIPHLVAIIQSWCRLKSSGILQINCVNKEDLEDALVHPERHQDLIVRLYGYSARFVTLEKIRQQEFITRQIL